MSATFTGRYVECDEKGCKAVFSLNLPWSKDGQTLHEARRAGWFIETTAAGHNRDRHLCPIHHPNDVG